MTDRESLRKRAEQAIAAYPDTMEGMGAPEPINVLDILRLYLTNALRNHQRSKPISPGNKRFMHSFGAEGVPCKDLLEFLEFVYNEVREDLFANMEVALADELGYWCVAPA